MTPALLSRLMQPSWRIERTVTKLVADIRREWPDPSDPLCDRLLDRLDHLDGLLDRLVTLLEGLPRRLVELRREVT